VEPLKLDLEVTTKRLVFKIMRFISQLENAFIEKTMPKMLCNVKIHAEFDLLWNKTTEEDSYLRQSGRKRTRNCN
jgi:hypothetical protein